MSKKSIDPVFTATTDGIEISVALASAMMQFASKDGTRFHMAGFGITDGGLGCTDGHAAVHLKNGAATSATLKEHNQVYWEGEHVELQIRVAKALLLHTLRLLWEDADKNGGYPPFDQIMHKQVSISSGDRVGFNPKYLGLLTKVAVALDKENVILESVTGPLDPMGFSVEASCGIRVTAVVMPFRV